MIHGRTTELRKQLDAAGVDAVLATSPVTMSYLSGYLSPTISAKKPGTESVLFATDPEVTMGMIVNGFEEMWARHACPRSEILAYSVWTEIDDRSALENGTTTIEPKPTQFDWQQVLDLVSQLVTSRNLDTGVLGIEMDRMPQHLLDMLRNRLPRVRWVDITAELSTVMGVKNPAEVDALRTAARIAEEGIRQVFMLSDPRGKSVSQLRNDFEIAVRNLVASDAELSGFQSSRTLITSGGRVGANMGRDPEIVRDGSLIWLDVGIGVDGYFSDIGRTILVGTMEPLTERIITSLEAGYHAGAAAIRVGAPLSEVFAATEHEIRKTGLPTFTRGHFGHGIGAGPGERAPFISPHETATFTPGMAFAFEVPYYVRGLGGFQFEDNFVVHDTTVERLTTLPPQVIRI